MARCMGGAPVLRALCPNRRAFAPPASPRCLRDHARMRPGRSPHAPDRRGGHSRRNSRCWGYRRPLFEADESTQAARVCATWRRPPSRSTGSRTSC